MGKLVITIGETLEAANERLFENVRRAKAGLPVEIDTRINFADARTMFAKLNLNRYEVLAFVAEHRPKSINAIATGVGRRYRRVHDDVHTLLELGLIDRQLDGSLGVGFGPTISEAEAEVIKESDRRVIVPADSAWSDWFAEDGFGFGAREQPPAQDLKDF